MVSLLQSLIGSFLTDRLEAASEQETRLGGCIRLYKKVGAIVIAFFYLAIIFWALWVGFQDFRANFLPVSILIAIMLFIAYAFWKGRTANQQDEA